MTDLQNLYLRRQMCQIAIEAIKGMDDPRAPEALEHYKGQLSEIERQISANQPAPVVVGLKSATLSGKTRE